MWSTLAVAVGVSAATEPAGGPWYLLIAPGGYLVAQGIFRMSVRVEGLPARHRNWLFLP